MINTYLIIQSNDDTILLEKWDIDFTKYTIVNLPNGDIKLHKIKEFIINNIDELINYNFSKSKISYCKIQFNDNIKNKFKSILTEIYNTINSGTQIIKNTKLNIKTIKKDDAGFYYLDNLGISIQGCDSNKCLLEIMHQCIQNNIKLNLKIKLKDNNLINITI